MGGPSVIGVKPETALWTLVALHQALTWNLHFSQWEHGWSNHNDFWTPRLFPSSLNLPHWFLTWTTASIALFAAICTTTRYRSIMTLGLLLGGGPFVWLLGYHWWVPYLFGCCGFWHNGASYVAANKVNSAVKGLRLFRSEFAQSLNLVPKLHGSPLFVDVSTLILTALVVAAVYYTVKGILWPYSEEEIEVWKASQQVESVKKKK